MAQSAQLAQRLHPVLQHVSQTLDIPLEISLWDGSRFALSQQDTQGYSLIIADESVIASLMRRPTLENIVRLYATGRIKLEGGNLMTIGQTLREKVKKKNLKQLNKSFVIKQLWPFLLVKGKAKELTHSFDNNETGENLKARNNQDYIQFHYDVSNEFYQLFLDPEMQYSCGYFTDWNNTLEQAQHDKLDMICRKLRLKEGERFLDIGCGWGGLICHAVQNYGVIAHGVTLSERQYAFATEKVKRLGIEDRVTIEIRDYETLEGTFDKAASIGMFEHIGLDNFPQYFQKVNELLAPNGLFLNHGIARRAKKNRRNQRNVTPEKHLILKYIFPGSELAPIGFSVDAMESHGFEIHDVEGWREHYALTCKHWCERLYERREEAIEYVGLERYNLWIAYLAGVSFGFHSGSILIYQTLATKRSKAKGLSGLPPTRADLYAA